jgi:hypothetical protein
MRMENCSWVTYSGCGSLQGGVHVALGLLCFVKKLQHSKHRRASRSRNSMHAMFQVINKYFEILILLIKSYQFHMCISV